MYVEDTDSLHWAPTPTTSDEELIERVQKADNNWGQLSQESGGILKLEKCSLYLLSYKFVRGRARLKSLADLPLVQAEVLTKEGERVPAHITVPQLDGTKAFIQTHEVTDASKMLGLHFAPCGNLTAHIEKMRQKGLEWADCLTAKPLPRRDAWFSFDHQLFMSMSWGLVAVLLPSEKLEKML